MYSLNYAKLLVGDVNLSVGGGESFVRIDITPEKCELFSVERIISVIIG